MQFAQMYDPVSKLPKNVQLLNGVSHGTIGLAEPTEDLEKHKNRAKDFHKIIIHHENKENMSVDEYKSKLLPKYIELTNPLPGEPQYLRLRSFPIAIKQNMINKDNKQHEYLYSELLLYKPFRNEEELHPHDMKQCAELYLECNEGEEITKLQKVKRILMEHQESVVEGREKAQEILCDAVGEELDPEFEQELADAESVGLLDHPDYPVMVPLDMGIQEHNNAQAFFIQVKLTQEDDLLCQLRILDEEQQYVHQVVIQYAKGIKKNNNGYPKKPIPPKLIVHGGAGSGKSTLIKCTIQSVERVMRKAGDELEQPYQLACAPTGTAAAVIDGNTLHHNFNFNFGNKYYSYDDKLRDLRRQQLINLILCLIDEFSMVKSDLLYQLDQRLREIKDIPKKKKETDNKKEEQFGGVAILLLGDLLQLRPVMANFIFDTPKNPEYKASFAYGSLWNDFDVINLIQNHRQGKDGEYADLLNRMRFGINEAKDFDLLEERVFAMGDPQIPLDTTFLFGKKMAVYLMNEERNSQLNSEDYILWAIHMHSSRRNYHPPINDDGTVSSTQFVHKLHLKVGSRVLLIHNVDVADKLTNGTLGEVLGFQKTAAGKITGVIVHFYNEKVGEKRLQNTTNTNLHVQYPNKRPIVIRREEVSYSLSKSHYNEGSTAKAKIIQYPLCLAFATTAHKFQGQTVLKPMTLTIDLETVFQAAQAYVMFSRVQEMSQLFILNCLLTKKIYADKDALREVEKMNSRAINNNLPPWHNPENNCERITFLNTRSLQKHIEDVKHNYMVKKSDILCLSETWLEKEDSIAYNINEYAQQHVVIAGRGKGLATYSQAEFTHVADVKNELFQISAFESSTTTVISVYRSQKANDEMLLQGIRKLCKKADPSKVCLVGGDFNICLTKHPTNIITTELAKDGFKQAVQEATIESGSIIDHCYIKKPLELGTTTSIEVIIKSVYWSDHDAVMVMVSNQQAEKCPTIHNLPSLIFD